jgi:hypothetical protein
MVKRSVKGDGCEGRRRTAAVNNCSADLAAKGGECTQCLRAGKVHVGSVSTTDDNGLASNGGKDDDNTQLKGW